MFLTLYVFQDPFAMLVGVATMITWYIADHDEYLKLFHYDHHRYVNSNYAIYVKLTGYDPLDKMKGLVK